VTASSSAILKAGAGSCTPEDPTEWRGSDTTPQGVLSTREGRSEAPWWPVSLHLPLLFQGLSVRVGRGAQAGQEGCGGTGEGRQQPSCGRAGQVVVIMWR